MADELNSNLLILGSYRSNAPEATDPLHIVDKSIQKLQHRSKKDFTLTTITLDILTLDAVQPIVNDLLNLDEHDNHITAPLAELCFRKTDGNVYFLLQYLKMLRKLDLIRFNYGSLKWEWDIGTLEASTAASDNVLDSILITLEDMEKGKKIILQIASCLGFSFDLKLLQLVWSKLRDPEQKQELQELIEQLLEGGFLVKTSGYSEQISCRFEHGKVREASMSMIGKEEKLV